MKLPQGSQTSRRYKMCFLQHRVFMYWFSFFLLSLKLIAVGNQTGKTFVWDIGVDDPTKARYKEAQVVTEEEEH